MHYVPDVQTKKPLAHILVGVWDFYVDTQHCAFQAPKDQTAAIAVSEPIKDIKARQQDFQVPPRATTCGDERKPDFYLEPIDHGTHVAAVLAARGSSRIIAGANPKAILWTYEINNGARIDQDNDPIINLAGKHTYGIPQVVNVSMAEPKQHGGSPIETYITTHSSKRTLFVAAAGGSKGTGTEIQKPHDCLTMPACLGTEDDRDSRDWVLSVVALDSQLRQLDFIESAAETHVGESESTMRYETNWGRAFNVAAIGEARSAVYGDYVKVLRGSSVAAPFVSGLASLLFAMEPDRADAPAVKRRIEYTSDFKNELDDVVGWGLINYERALSIDRDRLETRPEHCTTPPNCVVTPPRNIDRKGKSQILVVESAMKNSKETDLKEIDFKQVRRIARNPDGSGAFWVVLQNKEGRLEKYSGVRFRADTTLRYEGNQSPREISLATLENFTAKWEVR